MNFDDLSRFQVQLDIKFRVAEESDLPLLEWHGEFTHFRNLFRLTYEGQVRGERLMLLADVNGFPVGQVFLLFNQGTVLFQNVLRRKNNAPRQQRGYIYAFRVMSHLQGLGIGTRLMYESEAILMDQGCTWATISVAKDNPRAKKLYEHLKYQAYLEDEGRWNYVDHTGKVIQVHEPCWMMEKKLIRAENPILGDQA